MKKDAQKTQKKRKIGRPFTSDNQPENKGGRPKGKRDFKTDWKAYVGEKGDKEAFNQLYKEIQNGNMQAIKLYFEYLYGKPDQTIKNINHNTDITELYTDEEIRAEIERIKSGF